MLHKGQDGYWRRCIAQMRMGRGCSDCPAIVGNARAIHMGPAVIATIGGGTIVRGDREDCLVSKIDDHTGLFTRGPEGKRQQYLDGETGELVSMAERRDPENTRLRARRVAVVSPNPDVVAVNSETPEFFRKFFNQIKKSRRSYGGTIITKYNKKSLVETIYTAQDVLRENTPEHILKWNDSDRLREQSEAMEMAVYYNVVRKYSPQESVEEVLRQKRWGEYDPAVEAEAQKKAEAEARALRRAQQREALKSGVRGERKFSLNSYSTPVG